MEPKILAGALMSLFLCVGLVHADKMINVDEKVKHMQNKFNLTDDQANQVRPIIQEYKDKMENIKQDKEAKLSKILSQEQMNKMREEKMGKN